MQLIFSQIQNLQMGQEADVTGQTADQTAIGPPQLRHHECTILSRGIVMGGGVGGIGRGTDDACPRALGRGGIDRRPLPLQVQQDEGVPLQQLR